MKSTSVSVSASRGGVHHTANSLELALVEGENGGMVHAILVW